MYVVLWLKAYQTNAIKNEQYLIIIIISMFIFMHGFSGEHLDLSYKNSLSIKFRKLLIEKHYMQSNHEMKQIMCQ